MKKLQVIIVNYRSSRLTIRCVRSILEKGVASKDNIFIVDNFSCDDSVSALHQAFPDIQTINAHRNGGFGAGVNVGFRRTDSRHLLILNPDTYFAFDSVSPVVSFMETNPDVGLAGLDLINPDGSRQYSARRFYSVLDVCARRIEALGALMKNRIEHHLMKDQWQQSQPFDAEWVMGTGFIIRRDLFETLGGMDESYFLYMEDVDLCARVWGAGFKVKCMPGAELIHDHQRSSMAGPLTFAGRTHIRSLFLFGARFALPLFRPPGIEKIVQSCRGAI